MTGPILAEKARMFNATLPGPTDFKASQGFLQKFKKRHSLRSLSNQVQKLSADTAASDKFCQTFPQLCRDDNYELDHIYNADATGLYWKMLPNYSLVRPTERQAAGRKVPKDRVTVMVCTNASGIHKIPSLVIGKSQKPRCFKNLENLPGQYRGQKSAWITRELTLDWYKNIFLPAVTEKQGENRKVLLLLDNVIPASQNLKKSAICVG